MSENCGGCVIRDENGKEYLVPNIVINITINDNRVEEDASNYVDNVTMDCDCNGGDEIRLDME